MKKWLNRFGRGLVNFFGLGGSWILLNGVILAIYELNGGQNVDISTLGTIFIMYIFLHLTDKSKT
jgi:hypothetical protein